MLHKKMYFDVYTCKNIQFDASLNHYLTISIPKWNSALFKFSFCMWIATKLGTNNKCMHIY